MYIYQIVILAIIQGLTEFLPISSSGHLIIFPRFFGWADQGQVLDIAVHFGTLGAVLIYFWRDVWKMTVGFFQLVQGKLTPGGRLFLWLAIGTIPAVIIGFAISHFNVAPTLRSVKIIGYTMFVFGILLYLADRLAPKLETLKNFSTPKAFWVGVAQAVALIPGTSRSGICITAMRGLGFRRDEAARFSFLLSIPAILGAVTLEGYKAAKQGVLWAEKDNLVIGILVAFMAGLGAIHFMLRWLQKYDLKPFVLYRLVLGSFLLYWAYFLT